MVGYVFDEVFVGVYGGGVVGGDGGDEFVDLGV